MKPEKRKRPKRNGSRKRKEPWDHDVDAEIHELEITQGSKETPEDERIEKDLNRLVKDVAAC